MTSKLAQSTPSVERFIARGYRTEPAQKVGRFPFAGNVAPRRRPHLQITEQHGLKKESVHPFAVAATRAPAAAPRFAMAR
jgi:hypothetical protein